MCSCISVHDMYLNATKVHCVICTPMSPIISIRSTLKFISMSAEDLHVYKG